MSKYITGLALFLLVGCGPQSTYAPTEADESSAAESQAPAIPSNEALKIAEWAALDAYFDDLQESLDFVADISIFASETLQKWEPNKDLTLEVDLLYEGREGLQEHIDYLESVDPPRGIEPSREKLLESWKLVHRAVDAAMHAARSTDADEFLHWGDRYSDLVDESLATYDEAVELFNNRVDELIDDPDFHRNDDVVIHEKPD